MRQRWSKCSVLEAKRSKCFKKEQGEREGPTVPDAAERWWATPFSTSAQDLPQLSPVGIHKNNRGSLSDVCGEPSLREQVTHVAPGPGMQKASPQSPMVKIMLME